MSFGAGDLSCLCSLPRQSPLLPLVVLRFLSVVLVFVPRDHYMGHGGVSPSGKRSHKCTPAAECSKRFLTLLIPMPPADLCCLSCPDRTLSGEMWQKQSPHSSGCLPAVLAHTTAPLPHRWAQGTTGGFGWVRPPRQGLVPPSVLGCWGCPSSAPSCLLSGLCSAARSPSFSQFHL